MILPHQTLCERCRHLREIVSGKGSRFLMCLLSQTDARLPKYPPQPVRQCSGYVGREAMEISDLKFEISAHSHLPNS